MASPTAHPTPSPLPPPARSSPTVVVGPPPLATHAHSCPTPCQWPACVRTPLRVTHLQPKPPRSPASHAQARYALAAAAQGLHVRRTTATIPLPNCSLHSMRTSTRPRRPKIRNRCPYLAPTVAPTQLSSPHTCPESPSPEPSATTPRSAEALIACSSHVCAKPYIVVRALPSPSTSRWSHHTR